MVLENFVVVVDDVVAVVVVVVVVVVVIEAEYCHHDLVVVVVAGMRMMDKEEVGCQDTVLRYHLVLVVRKYVPVTMIYVVPSIVVEVEVVPSFPPHVVGRNS
jgi:hypothetical protein